MVVSLFDELLNKSFEPHTPAVQNKQRAYRMKQALLTSQLKDTGLKIRFNPLIPNRKQNQTESK
jgi:hypothetical protein